MTPKREIGCDITRPRAPVDRGPQSWLSATADELAARFEVQPEIGRITALVGPPGSGKTSTLVKLAVSQCLRHGRTVRFISADNMRVGAAEQLRTYATILGAQFQAVESIVALTQAIDSAPPGADIEIDGAFVGNTPSTVAVVTGSHQIAIKKKGFTDWTKTLSVTGGTVHLSAELEQEQPKQ